MELRSIEAFVRVAELGSITRASRDLGIVQPALSRHIQRIETELGTSLLVRLPRGVQLTMAGRRFLQHSRHILQEVARATQDMNIAGDCLSGRVVVGISPTLSSLLAPGLIERCTTAHPAISLTIVEEFTRRLQTDLVNGQVDIALLTNPPPNRALRFTAVVTEPIVVVMPRQSRGVSPVVTFDELAATPMLVTRGIRGLVDEQLASHGVCLEIDCEVDAVEAIRRMLLRGRGVTIMPISAFRKEIDEGQLTGVAIGGVNLSRTIMLSHVGDKVSAAVQAVMGLLRAEIDAHAQRGLFSALPDISPQPRTLAGAA
ncbi:LysR family transcriptional regulator [Ancylobacter mangrovi]|uniref:LysR family transcriptional regulator n=1 Tax=Ancylobacter mangrovi TaxID=2972472 RepID=A0A9X2T2V9_9HYPH|nr:LysR family transcriptional regulator [Ancylobacter mangrovi]MCS0496297.1 LysR family transcriptional regulator [Ancylobacter mangrovi]MCS0504295.1 LysR family transcriptional regulator [Ancylobacter mangrovi]